MYQVLDIMNEYFDEKNASSKSLLEEKKLPVKTQKNQWVYEKDPERLVAKFTFKGSDSYAFFISELASLEKKLSHHGNIVCSYPTVDISVRTHDLELVTKADITYTKKVLEIYRDTIVLEKKL